jgi:hypothetical protein
MDPITPLGTPTYLNPPPTSTASQSPAPATPSVPVDSISLSEADADNLANIYSAPDASFVTLLQNDPELAQAYSLSSQDQFGFDDLVLSTDDTLPAASPSSTTATAAPSTESAAVDQKVALGALAFDGGVTAALFGTQSSADPSAIFFMGASMNNLLTARGTAALAYLTPQAAAAGASVNTTGASVNASA